MMSYTAFGKRFLDICLSIIATFAFCPVLIFVAILIKSNSKGPIFFKQIRIGKDFTPFRLIKFRTMSLEPVAESREFEPGCRSRVTRIGRILRATKIDELPELFNILKGDMSIIGPRPEVPQYVKVFKNDFAKILNVRPGLSDPASIKYRDEEKILQHQTDPIRYYTEIIMPDKLALSISYVKSISFNKDLRIVIDTVKCILKR